jgi:hypothetical protein
MKGKIYDGIELTGVEVTLWILSERCSVRISAGTPAVLAEMSRGFPQSHRQILR